MLANIGVGPANKTGTAVGVRAVGAIPDEFLGLANFRWVRGPQCACSVGAEIASAFAEQSSGTTFAEALWRGARLVVVKVAVGRQSTIVGAGAVCTNSSRLDAETVGANASASTGKEAPLAAAQSCVNLWLASAAVW